MGCGAVDAADLDRQVRTLSGCIPPPLVDRLLELGHEQEVESQAGQGEWFGARAWAQLLGERRQQDRALEVLAPYVATGWWPAARAQAELLESWGRAREAIALTRPHAQAGDRMALDFVGRLMAATTMAPKPSSCCAPESRTGFSPLCWWTPPRC